VLSKLEVAMFLDAVGTGVGVFGCVADSAGLDAARLVLGSGKDTMVVIWPLLGDGDWIESVACLVSDPRCPSWSDDPNGRPEVSVCASLCTSLSASANGARALVVSPST